MEINGHRCRFGEVSRSKKRTAGGFHSTASISGVFCSNNFTNAHTHTHTHTHTLGVKGNEKDDLMNTEEVDEDGRRKKRTSKCLVPLWKEEH